MREPRSSSSSIARFSSSISDIFEYGQPGGRYLLFDRNEVSGWWEEAGAVEYKMLFSVVDPDDQDPHETDSM